MTVPSWVVWLIGVYVAGKIVAGAWSTVKGFLTTEGAEGELGGPVLTEQDLEGANCNICKWFPCSHDVTRETFLQETAEGAHPYCNWVYYEKKDGLPTMQERQSVTSI